MQLDLLPDISLPYLMVLTTYPGASSEKIETEICEPMEASLGTINGIKSVTSVCNENYGMVQLEFVDDTDLDSAMVKVSSALNTLEPYLPDDAGTPSIIEISTDMVASVYLAVSMEGMEMEELSQFVRDEITPQYEKQNGVASVTTLGLVDKSVEVRLNEKKIDELNARILDTVEDAFADGFHVLLDKFVLDGHFHLRIVGNLRIHILHAGGNANQLRLIVRHAVTHRHPLQFKVFLRELLVIWLTVFPIGQTIR